MWAHRMLGLLALLAIWEVCPCEGNCIARNLSEALVFNANRLLSSFYRLNPPGFSPCGVVHKHSQKRKKERGGGLVQSFVPKPCLAVFFLFF